ncbi:response regulator [Pedobacter fastidiosus]|uniref:Response regulator transcription factor n=1 Tax=Pedobacter fastidiosus TaxID=2765361 RepID=A0ABR7KT83_9SPHI|nr:response regulator transcription factor [Pedobacter fastidiosus]MBC6111193.1 response regulator transcription factor [Pedobacter fastidiosus]
MDISIVEDHKLVAQFLKTSLLQLNFVESVRVYSTGSDFLQNLDLLKTDLLILDVYLPDINGLDLVLELRKTKAKSDLRIVMFSSVIDQGLISKAFELGANGFFPKDISLDELSKLIKSIHNSPLDTYLGEGLMQIAPLRKVENKTNIHLSPIELRLIKQIDGFKTIDEIALDMDLSFETVQFYINQIIRKFKVEDLNQLRNKAKEQGLIS